MLLNIAKIATLALLAITATAASIPFPLDSAIRTKEDAVAYLEANNITVTTGYYDHTSLAKRAWPSECQFGFTMVGNYHKFDLKDGKVACLAWENPCDTSRYWSDPDWTDIQKCASDIVSQDGWLSGAYRGNWRASFILGPSAFKNRDTSLFTVALLATGMQFDYYWNYLGDRAQIHYSSDFETRRKLGCRGF